MQLCLVMNKGRSMEMSPQVQKADMCKQTDEVTVVTNLMSEKGCIRSKVKQ